MTRRGWIVAAGAAGLGLLLWVTSSAPVTVVGPPQDPFELPRATIRPRTRAVPSVTGSPPPGPTIDMSRANDGPTIVGLLLQILAVAVVAAVVVAVAYYVVRLVRFRREAPKDTEFAPLPDVAASVTEDAEAQLAALAGGPPRNAIVACWLRLEESVAAAGVPRHPSETSAELTARVLGRLRVDPDSITRLARLFRLARFSTHELDETSRQEAVRCLRRIHEDLRQQGAGPADGQPVGTTDNDNGGSR